VTDRLFIGSGAGFAGDRFDAAMPVVETLSRCPGPRYLIYEVMGERTLAIAQRLKRENPSKGYSPWLDVYLPTVIGACIKHNIRIVANFGNANPAAAARRAYQIAHEAGASRPRVAIVSGDDILEFTQAAELQSLPTMEGTETRGRVLHAANAYLGARPIAEALSLGVDIVLVGRSTDAALVLGPLIHEYQWREDHYDLLACGTTAGHLLECGGQISGGYFADPGYKDVPDLHDLGFPIAEVHRNGDFIISKADDTGGVVNKATVTEQLLYEMHDPEAYLTPDVTLDISAVQLTEVEPDRILVTGARGRPPPPTLKVTLSLEGGWLGEAEISYAGVNSLARAKLAADVVRRRLQLLAEGCKCRVELIGTCAVHDDDSGSCALDYTSSSGGEYRLRVAVRSETRAIAQRIADEVLALYCCGPSAGGGVRQSVSPQISTASVLVDRQLIEPHTRVVEIMCDD